MKTHTLNILRKLAAANDDFMDRSLALHDRAVANAQYRDYRGTNYGGFAYSGHNPMYADTPTTPQTTVQSSAISEPSEQPQQQPSGYTQQGPQAYPVGGDDSSGGGLGFFGGLGLLGLGFGAKMLWDRLSRSSASGNGTSTTKDAYNSKAVTPANLNNAPKPVTGTDYDLVNSGGHVTYDPQRNGGYQHRMSREELKRHYDRNKGSKPYKRYSSADAYADEMERRYRDRAGKVDDQRKAVGGKQVFGN